MDFSYSNSFKGIYEDKKKLHPSICDVDPIVIPLLQEQLRKSTAISRIRFQVILYGSALSVLVMTLIIVHPIHNFTGIFVELLFAKGASIDLFTNQYISDIFYVMVFLFLSPLSMARRLKKDRDYFMPEGAKNVSRYYIKPQEIKSFKHFPTLVIMEVLLGLLLLSIVLIKIFGFLAFYLKEEIHLTCTALVLMPIIVFSYSYSRFFWFKLLRSNNKFRFSEDRRVEIVMTLLNVLHWVDYSSSLSVFQKFPSIAFQNSLQTISNSIENYYTRIYWGKYKEAGIKQYLSASAQFDSTSYKLIEANKTQEFKDHIINYLNIFLLAEYDKLPKIPDGEMIPEIGKKFKFSQYFLLLIYAITPVLVLIVFLKIFDIKIDEFTQGMLKILYGIWIVLGLIASPLARLLERNDFYKDLIKNVLGKS